MELFGITVVIVLQLLILFQLKGERKIMATSAQALSDLQNQVAAELTVEQSAVTLLQQLAAAVSAANGVSPDAVEAVVAQIKAHADALAAAVTANTPVAPPLATT